MATTALSTVRFAPYKLGSWLLWGFAALAFVFAPLVFSGGFAITLLIGITTSIFTAVSCTRLFFDFQANRRGFDRVSI